MTEQEFRSLLEGFKQQTLTAEELVIFFQQAGRAEFRAIMGDAVVYDLENKSYAGATDREREQKVWQQFESDFLTAEIQSADAPPVFTIPAHKKHFIKPTWLRYAAAVILLVCVCAYLWKTTWSHNNNNTISDTELAPGKDIAPGGQRAILTLEDGTTIVLDSAANGQLATQGSTVISKKSNGQIEYNPGHFHHPVSLVKAFNTMSTPKGGQFQVTLSDGTRVWLNAASSITFPIAFKGATREVSVTGEAYFEVVTDKEKPFIVKTPEDQITVLGTSFNVQAYTDETAGKISLLHGSVKVANTILHPGQAFVKGKIVATDLQQDIAWKNGAFNFNHMRLKNVMRQLERWYDIEVKFEGKIPDDEFSGEMGRDLTLSEVLDALKILDVHYKIVNRTLIVAP